MDRLIQLTWGQPSSAVRRSEAPQDLSWCGHSCPHFWRSKLTTHPERHRDRWSKLRRDLKAARRSCVHAL